MPTDPTAPAWVLDVAEDVTRLMRERLSAVMLERGEDITDDGLWRLRRSQLESLLASGKVLAVKRSEPEPQCARFAEFYSVRYGDVGSGGRALVVETDDAMEIRPLTDRRVIVKRA